MSGIREWVIFNAGFMQIYLSVQSIKRIEI